MQKESEIYSFNPVMDWWVAAIVIVFLGMILFSIPVLIWSNLPLFSTVVSVAFLIASFLMLIDRFFFTKYTLHEHGLIVQGQMRHILFPYRSMKTIQNGGVKGLISFGSRKRFALSSNCLIITLQNQDWKTISISPKAKQEFLDILLSNIDHERSTRASASHKKK